MANNFTRRDAEERLLDIIEGTEDGFYTPEEASREVGYLERDAERAGLNYKTDYTLEDFQKIRESALSNYLLSDEDEIFPAEFEDEEEY